MLREGFLMLMQRCFKFSALLVASIIVIFIGIKSFSHSHPPQVTLRREGDRLVIPEGSPIRTAIQTQLVKQQKISIPLLLPATVKAIPTQWVNVTPPVTGRVMQINKLSGENVRVGEVLFTLKSADVARILSNIQKAKAAAILAKQTLLRQQKLAAADIGSRMELQQAQNNFEQTESELNRTEALLKVFKIQNKGKNIIDIRSPLNGQVIDVAAGVGSFWSDLTVPVMTVANLSKVYVIANVQEKDIHELYLGQAMALQFDGIPQQQHAAKVDYISPVLNEDTRTVEVSAILDNQKGHFKPNMFAKCFLMRRPLERIMVPLTAVLQRGFDSIVFVEVAPWQFEPRLVEIGYQIAQKVEIISGLQAGERIAITGGLVLND